MNIDSSEYQLRGNRVAPLTFFEVKQFAEFFAKVLNVNKHTPKNMADFIESLPHIFDFDLNIEIVEDNDWLWVTEANYDPESKTITMPNSLYNHAISGDSKSIGIIFHEIGHFFLNHKAILHHSSEQPKECECSEIQADTFSDCIMQIMKISSSKQYELGF